MEALLTNSRERTRFFRFAIVGAVGALIDFGVFNLLNGVFGIIGVVAQSISFAVAVFSNFTWNRLWTFPDSRTKALSRQLAQFFIVNAIGIVIRTPIFVLLEGPLRRLFSHYRTLLPAGKLLTPDFLGHNLALGIAIGVVLIWNYFVNRHWTYNDVN